VNSARLTRKRIISCVLFNLLGTPGLGSVMARRWFAGIGQIILSLVGFVLMMVWFYKLVIVQFYGQINGPVTPHPVGWIALLGAVLFALAWFWSAVTSLSLLRGTSAEKRRALENSTAPPVQKLTEAKIISALASVPDWKLQDATISRTFQFKDFPAAIKFVEVVAGIAEEAWHHPDIDIRWNKVTLALTTHDAGGLTEKDFALARQFDQL
jgi:4a-hydroxytetrahydrobiopterin dehydratase